MRLLNWSDSATIADRGCWTRVTSLDQLGSVLANEDTKVRVLGSRYTYPPHILCPDQTRAIVLDLPDRGVPKLSGDTVRVTGDTLLEDVWQTLEKHGLEPDICPPVITAQTVAGAIATGTHAQGMLGGTFSDCVSAIELVDGNGVFHRLTPADDEFESAILNLGCLGVVVALELRGRPATTLSCHRFTVAEVCLPELYPQWNRKSVATKTWWFTEHQVAHVWITDGDADSARDPRVIDSTDIDDVVTRTRHHLMADIGDVRGETPAARTLEKFLGAESTKGTLYEIFKNGIPAPQLNMEIAVPLGAFPDACDSLRDLLRASSYKLHYPVILRTTGQARGLLSPTRTIPSTYFGFVSYMNAEGRLPPAARALFDDIQGLLYGFGGRPHWGKYFTPDLVRAAGTEGFPEFCRAVRTFDPHGRFQNRTFYRTIGLDVE
jgi:FAD/FMN-containing dehydrogenase